MNLLTELYKTYNQSIEQGIVDNHKISQTILLPLYHNNLKSNGKNIIRIYLNTNSTLARAEILSEDEVIIFPVNEDSVARSGRKAFPHPLVDKLEYINPSDSWKHQKYTETFSKWYNYLKDEQSKEYLNIIKEFIENKNMLKQIVDKLFEGTKYKQIGYKLEYEETSGKNMVTKKLDLSKVFLTYSIIGFEGLKNVNVTNNTKLHEDYIEYVDANLVPNGICGITGEYSYISPKHRGLLGNAKLVSVSNNKETYIGRFNAESDVFNMSYQASEKIHLMLKYLLENKNSSKWLSEQQYLVNWISSDIMNDSQLDILSSHPLQLFNEGEIKDKVSGQPELKPVTLRNKQVGKSITQGKITFPEDSKYYISIIDKSSNGRLSVKYFKKLAMSQLEENLKKWHTNNSWEAYNPRTEKSEDKTPSVYDIVMVTHALERDGRFVLDNGNFKKNLYQQLIKCIVDGLPVPKDYLMNLDLNIRQRLNYPKRWRSLLHVACSLLNNTKEGEFTTMVDKNNTDRSYLFGRLLALYEITELRTFNREERRVTNASKFWSSYTNNPENIMQTLEEKIKPYERRLMTSNPGIHFKIQKEKQEIITMLDQYSDKKDANKRLGYQFIYGYYSENKFIYTKQEEEIEYA
jgi:CRISPR-associated protein Csd1